MLLQHCCESDRWKCCPRALSVSSLKVHRFDSLTGPWKCIFQSARNTQTSLQIPTVV